MPSDKQGEAYLSFETMAGQKKRLCPFTTLLLLNSTPAEWSADRLLFVLCVPARLTESTLLFTATAWSRKGRIFFYSCSSAIHIQINRNICTTAHESTCAGQTSLITHLCFAQFCIVFYINVLLVFLIYSLWRTLTEKINMQKEAGPSFKVTSTVLILAHWVLISLFIYRNVLTHN